MIESDLPQKKEQKTAPFGVGVEYALHSLLSLVDVPGDRNLGIREIAAFQGISETYLSKIFARLKKAGIVRSSPGVKGGYELARTPEKITFWDVVSAVEGPISLFQCRNVRASCILYQGQEVPPWVTEHTCTIHAVMLQAEARMRQHLQEKTLAWLHAEVESFLPEERKTASARWFEEALAR